MTLERNAAGAPESHIDLTQLPTEQKRQLFDREIRAREGSLRILFDLSIEAGDEEKRTSESLPSLGTTIEDLRRYNEAVDDHYYRTWYAPEIFADALFTALFDFNQWFLTEVVGVNPKKAPKIPLGSLCVGDARFHEVVCALRNHSAHFNEHAAIKKIEEAARPAKHSLAMLRRMNFPLPADETLSHAVLVMLSNHGDFQQIMRLQRSILNDALGHPNATR